ncbi:MAG: prolipoprotein diacylglyceryl transferase [Clostridia bacterium]|nr:prolipoprotein diacylglyceryl transferase [Clostridia bacterium]
MALIGDTVTISWFGVFVAFGCLMGIVIACVLRGTQAKPVSDIFISMIFSIPLGLLCARWFYCLFSMREFEGLAQMTKLTEGGYGLYGAIFGVYLGVSTAMLVADIDDFGGIMDCLAVGGAFAVAVGRFATYFTGTELGYEVDFSFMTVYDEAHDLHVFAVYWLDGLLELVVFGVSLWFFRFCQRDSHPEHTEGKTALVMLALHGFNQVICDSMRADGLKLGVNRFINIAQIIGIVSGVVILLLLLVEAIKKDRFRLGHFFSFLILLECIAFGVLAEYRVGKGNYISKHLMMLGAMVFLSAMVVHYAKYARISEPGKTAANKKART